MPEKTIDTLVDDIYALFDADGGFDEELFNKFGVNLTDLMTKRFNERRDDNPRLYMSNIGRKDRQLWYDIHRKADKEKLLPQTLIKFSYGDMIEELILLYARMAGHTVEREQERVVLDGISGRIDAIIDGVVVDVKSASSFSYQKFEKGTLFEEGNDPFGYVAQLAGYIEAINPGGRGGFLAVDKTLGKICFCEAPRDVLDRYKVRERIAHITEVVASEVVPPRCYDPVPDGKSGNEKLPTGCSYCPHKFLCWDDANGGEGLKTYYYSNGPRYLTKVVKPPKVDEFPSEI